MSSEALDLDEVRTTDETEFYATFVCASCRAESGCPIFVDPIDGEVTYSTPWHRIQVVHLHEGGATRTPDVWFCPACVGGDVPEVGEHLQQRVRDMATRALGLAS